MLDFIVSDTLSERLKAGAAASADLTPAMAIIADVMRTQALDRFEAETGPDGKKWKQSLRAKEQGGLTLTDSGQLRTSLTAASDATSAILGTNLIYAAIHQFGGTIRAKGTANGGARALKTPFGPRGSVTMPARPFLGFGVDDTKEIEGILLDHLAVALGDAAEVRP